MLNGHKSLLIVKMWLLLGASLAQVGCHSFGVRHDIAQSSVPRELDKLSLPEYRIEPPDILQIDAVRVVPKPPYLIQPLDTLFVQVRGVEAPGVLPPIAGVFAVEPQGTIRLGGDYGSVKIAGMTLAEAATTIEAALKKLGFQKPQATLALDQIRGIQQIQGQHLVRPDGTVALGIYGSVHVAGKTMDEARLAIEEYLSKDLLDPQVALDVFSYNSKFYYVITDGARLGEQVFRFPVTGSETVLDAISQVNGLPLVASKSRMWVARPSPAHDGADQILPIHWQDVARRGNTATNYQIMPGDRIYVDSKSVIALNNVVAELLSPVERVLGILLLGNSTVRVFGSGGGRGGFIGGGGF